MDVNTTTTTADLLSASDLDQLGALATHCWRHTPARAQAAAALLKELADARRVPRYLFLPEPGKQWFIGALDAPDARPRPPYTATRGLRGIAIAHYVIARREPVPYDCTLLRALDDDGAMTQKACDNALRAARKWVQAETGCTAVAVAIERIIARRDYLHYVPQRGDAEIIVAV